jgi:putative transposase
LPGHLVNGKPTSAPKLSLAELDRAITAYITNTYHARIHSETDQTPLNAWRGRGFLPRLPETLEELDLLLVMHAKPRTVRRDGIHFQGLRYQNPTMAGYVGDAVTIRYDPRDLSEIRFLPQYVPLPCRQQGTCERGRKPKRYSGGAAYSSPLLAQDHQ